MKIVKDKDRVPISAQQGKHSIPPEAAKFMDVIRSLRIRQSITVEGEKISRLASWRVLLKTQGIYTLLRTVTREPRIVRVWRVTRRMVEHHSSACGEKGMYADVLAVVRAIPQDGTPHAYPERVMSRARFGGAISYARRQLPRVTIAWNYDTNTLVPTITVSPKEPEGA